MASTDKGDAGTFNYFQLLQDSKSGHAEDELFTRQVEEVKAWWASPRFKGVKRPYSAEDVVSSRGSLQQNYPSSIMAQKLFNLIEEKRRKRQPLHICICQVESYRHVH